MSKSPQVITATKNHLISPSAGCRNSLKYANKFYSSALQLVVSVQEPTLNAVGKYCTLNTIGRCLCLDLLNAP